MYGACVRCGEAVFAWHLDAVLVAENPASGLLCKFHFVALVEARREAERRRIRDASRVYCSCGREIVLRPAERKTCTWCELGQPVSVGVVDNGRTSIRPVEYVSRPCDFPFCDAKLSYLLPDGRVLCDDHGAPHKSKDEQ